MVVDVGDVGDVWVVLQRQLHRFDALLVLLVREVGPALVVEDLWIFFIDVPCGL